MIIKNYMEDYVSKLVKFVLRQRKEKLGEKGEYDVIAYVLNRVRPRYMVSSRGQIHTIKDLFYSFQERADILKLILEAIDIVKSRRKSDSTEILLEGIEQNKSYFIFPVLMGRVFDEDYFPAIGAEVTLLMNGKKMEMINSSWSNPYILNKSSKEYFNFLAKPIPAEDLGKVCEFPLDVKITLRGFKDYIYRVDLSLKSIIMIEGLSLFDEIKDIGTIVIERKKRGS